MPVFPQFGLEAVIKGWSLFESRMSRAERMYKRLGDEATTLEAKTARQTRALGALGVVMGMVGGVAFATATQLARHALESERIAIAAETAARVTNVSTEAFVREREELRSLFVAGRAANEMLTKMIVSQLDVGKASELARVALDFSTLSTKTGSEVVSDFTDAVTSQNLATLKQYGLATSTTKVFQWFGKTIDKTADQLNTAERRQAIWNYLITVGSGLQGAYNRMLASASGELEKLRFWISEVSDRLGTALLPVVSSVLSRVNDLLARIEALPEPIQAAIARTLAFGGALLVAAASLTFLAPGMRILIGALQELPGLLMAGLAGLGKLGIVLAGIAPIAVTAGLVLVSSFDSIQDAANQTVIALVRSISRAYTESVPWLKAFGSLLWDGFVTAFRIVTGQVRKMGSDMTKADWGFKFDAERFFTGAASLMGSFAAGFLWAYNKFVLPTIIMVAQSMADFLGSSLPTKGPLADIELAGIELIQTWVRGMSKASLKAVTKIAEKTKKELMRALWDIQDALYEIETRELELAKALQPFEDALFLARAQADLVVIPLEQQHRALEKQIEDLQEVAAAERERAEEYLRSLEAQAEMMKKVIAADEERLETLDHEIFMEEQRNRILGKATSARLLQLKSERAAAQDTAERNKTALKTTERQITAEEKRLGEITTAAEAQIKVLQTQLEAAAESIEFERERVLLTEESLRLEEARQAQAQLALLEERRFWEAEQREAQHYLEIIGRLPHLVEEVAKKAGEELQKFFDTWEEWKPEKPELEEVVAGIGVNIEALKQKILEAFAKPIDEQVKETERLLGELRGVLAKHGEEEGTIWDALGNLWNSYWQRRIENFKTNIGIMRDWFLNWWNNRLEDYKTWSAKIETEINKWYANTKASLSKWLEDRKTDITKWFNDRLYDAGKFLDEWVFGWREKWEELKWEITNWLLNRKEDIQTWFAARLADLKKWGEDQVAAWIANMAAGAVEIALGLANWLANFVKWLLVDMPKFWEDAKTEFKAKLRSLFDVVKEWFEKTGIPEMIEHGKNAIGNLVAAAAEWISDNIRKIKDLGKDIIDGIKKGIEGAWTGFKSWLRGLLWDLIWKLIPDWLKGGSPAMIAVPIGESIVQGIRMGFEREMARWAPRIRTELDIGRRVSAVEPRAIGGAVTNVYNYGAPTYQLTAHYRGVETEASIRDDLRMMMALA